MEVATVFVGTKFLYNVALQEYILRQVKQVGCEIRLIRFYKDGENSLFLELEDLIAQCDALIIATTKQSFATVGKLLCTITEDTLILKEDVLVPTRVQTYTQDSYLLEFKKTKINLVAVEADQKIPKILLEYPTQKTVVQLFDETQANAKILLGPLAQTYDVRIEYVTVLSGWLELHIFAKNVKNITQFVTAAKRLLPDKIIVAENIVTYIIETLAKRGKTITFAESCTGGLLSYFFTKHNGASQIFNGALITYANDIKASWLAVEKEALERFGAVSAQVVAQMSEGALGVSEADYALSISGIAGDGGGTPEKPVGTVYIGVRSARMHIEEHFRFFGDRNYVQYQSALQAIKMLVTSDKETFFYEE